MDFSQHFYNVTLPYKHSSISLSRQNFVLCSLLGHALVFIGIYSMETTAVYVI